jgi:hypothetical protein
MTPVRTTAPLLASNPGPAAHLAMLAIAVVVGLIGFAVVRRRNARDAAEGRRLDDLSHDEHTHGEPHEPPRGGPGHD